MTLLDDLRRDLDDKEVLVIAGTGVSVQATGRAPCSSWDGLILNGIEHCVGANLLDDKSAARLRKQLQQKSVEKRLAVAEDISKALGAPDGGEFRRWLRDSVGGLEPRHPELLDAIHAIGAPIATTNYDDLLSRGRGIAAIPWTDGAAAHEIIRGDRTGILHLHGHYDDPESVILGVRSYEEILSHPGAQALQQALAATKTLLFVGCGDGLSDPNFGALLRWADRAFGGTIYRHYCLCRKEEQKELTKRKLSKRLFSVDYGEKYEELAPFLRDNLARKRDAPPTLPSPGYCFGREVEVGQVVSALLDEDPRPLPILGGPGMGKTTIALQAVHDPRVAAKFGTRRWFVRCDGAKSPTDLAAAIARSMGIAITPDIEPIVVDALSTSPAALILDNAETPLDADRKCTEDFLSLLCTVPALALVVTIRGHQRPRGVPWRPTTEAERLQEDTSREVFAAASGNEAFATDPHLSKLLSVLDGVPLALTLMGRYAEVYRSLEPVWNLWNTKRTAMLKYGAGEDRLSNIAVSYELSFGVLSLNAQRLLSVLAMLPEGVAYIDLPAIFHEPDDPAHELRARALAFDEENRLRMLAPLREYVSTVHAPTTEDAEYATAHYVTMAAKGDDIGTARAAAAISRLVPEVANLEASLRRMASVSGVRGFCELMRFTGLGSTVVLEQVATEALSVGADRLAAQCLESLVSRPA